MPLRLFLFLSLTGCWSSDSVEKNTSPQAPLASGEKSTTKPWLSTPELMVRGKKSYDKNCALCHGEEGKGDGYAARGLEPAPRNLVLGNWSEDGSTIGLFKTIKNGIAKTAMPSFGHLPLEERWALVHHLQAVTKNKIISDSEDLEVFSQSNR